MEAVRYLLYIHSFILLTFRGLCLENNLARTPPMGWLSWTRFMCQIDCEKFPNDCINEKLFMQMADVMKNEGYRDAGYVFVNLDDCWMAKNRSASGQLVADPKRFPHGIKWLAEYMHINGLKLGIYENFGKQTCMGFPGSIDHLKKDAETFLTWDVDMVKFDGCFTDPRLMDAGYPKMGSYLDKSEKKVVYSCSWPYYVRKEMQTEPDYALISKHCNLWRNYDDIQGHWKSIEAIIQFYDKHQDVFAEHHGPGHWNDPDMLIIGNPGLTTGQCRAQMALWCIWSAPLLMSNDLRDIKPEFKEILLNRKAIAINQDPLGVMGKKIQEFANGKVVLYKKPLSPVVGSQMEKDVSFANDAFAIAILNKDEHQVKVVKLTLASIGLTHPTGYSVEDVFAPESSQPRAWHGPDEQLELAVAPTSVIFWRLEQTSAVVEGELSASGDDQMQFNWLYVYVIITLVVIYLVVRRRFCRRGSRKRFF